MKNTVLTISCIFLTTALLFAQSITKSNKLTEEPVIALNETALSDRLPVCLPPGCRCEGGITEIQLYYLGTNDVNIEVFRDQIYTDLIATIPNVTTGDLITVSALALQNGEFAYYTYFRVTDLITGDVCFNRIYTQCPRNVWPGALSDLQILGKRYGDLFVYGYTSSAENQQCDIGDIEQYWKVGGNIVAPDNMTFGTLNNEAVSIITNNQERGIITNDGDFGFGVNPPEARIHVGGNARIDAALDVYGVTTIHNTISSTNLTNGALVVSGGVGIAENLNVGDNLNVDGTATIGGFTLIDDNARITGNLDTDGNLNVDGTVTIDGFTLVDNNARITGNLTTNGNLDVDLTATIDGFTQINDNARITGNLNLNGRLTLGNAGLAHLGVSGMDLIMENEVGSVRFEASNEEMMIISNTQVEVKKRLIVTGADLAERFSVNNHFKKVMPSILPGMVLSIDRNNPGELIVSNKPYDKTVAGIVSGAGGINTAMLLGQEGTMADGDVPVAITGRVYCYVDANYGAIEPGDLLTTSATFGHAMKVNNYDEAKGAIIGKAMSPLKEGKGLVLVLISMQ